MKTKKSFYSALVLAMFCMGYGTISAQNKSGDISLNVQKLSMSKWNSPDGIPYKEVPGFNLGVISFDVLGGNKIAYLSSASNEVMIADQASGSVIKKFPVPVAPRDMAYDNGFFYVLNARLVSVYDVNGNFSKTISFPGSYTGVERIIRYGNATYLLLPEGNSLKIESAGNVIDAKKKKQEGWITSAGLFVSTKISGGNGYSFIVMTPDGKRFEKSVVTDSKTAGVYVVGATSSRIYLDVQSFVSESPIRVQRNIVSVELTSVGLGDLLAGIQVPDCYYVLTNNDFHLASDGSVLNMVTSPQGVFVYALKESNAKDAAGYPDFLLAAKYHFNDHLMQVDAK